MPLYVDVNYKMRFEFVKFPELYFLASHNLRALCIKWSTAVDYGRPLIEKDPNQRMSLVFEHGHQKLFFPSFKFSLRQLLGKLHRSNEFEIIGSKSEEGCASIKCIFRLRNYDQN